MSTATLTIDLTAIRANWRALNARTQCETAAVVKANAYGLGASTVARALAQEGARHFFVAAAEEGVSVRKAVGQDLPIYLFSGHMAGDTDLIRDYNLIPMLNSVDQLIRHAENLSNHPFGIQLDTGMNRLGMEPVEWQAVRDIALHLGPKLLISHLACSDDPSHAMNEQQWQSFVDMTQDLDIPKSLSATGGLLLGEKYHFDMTRPGIGIYGGLPFTKAKPVATISIPVIQIREVDTGETVGYSNTWVAPTPRRIATVSAGYADGIIRAMGPKTRLYSGNVGCPIVGRISMDLIGVDITLLSETPTSLELLNAHQTIDVLADNAGTIGYEILTSLGGRYRRKYLGDLA